MHTRFQFKNSTLLTLGAAWARKQDVAIVAETNDLATSMFESLIDILRKYGAEMNIGQEWRLTYPDGGSVRVVVAETIIGDLITLHTAHVC